MAARPADAGAGAGARAARKREAAPLPVVYEDAAGGECAEDAAGAVGAHGGGGGGASGADAGGACGQGAGGAGVQNDSGADARSASGAGARGACGAGAQNAGGADAQNACGVDAQSAGGAGAHAAGGGARAAAADGSADAPSACETDAFGKCASESEQEGELLGSPHSRESIKARIQEISADASLTEAERNRRRQALFSQSYQKKQLEQAVAFRKAMDAQRWQKSYSPVLDPETGERMLGCAHYPRKCKLQAACCGMWVVCRLCHDHPDMVVDHTIVRYDTKRVMCMECNTEQDVGTHCCNPECGTEFAKYFCKVCKFYDNTPGKDIYHCHKCKICRVGKGLGRDNFHCDRCDACVSLESPKNHQCLKKSLDANCPICGTYLFTSTQPVVFMRCGHTMHSHCFDEYTSEHYVCPLCHKALTDMRPYYERIDDVVSRDEMPEEHRNKWVKVMCHDCGAHTRTRYHYLYHKCMARDCASYNTRVLHMLPQDGGTGDEDSGTASDESGASGTASDQGDQSDFSDLDVSEADVSESDAQSEAVEAQCNSSDSDGSAE